jgi:hypothetical protein
MPNDLIERLRSGMSLILTFIALFAVGPLVAMLVARLHGPHGGTDTTLLVSDAFIGGIIACIAIAIGAGLLGVIKAKLFGWHRGFTVAGFVVAWAAFRAGDMRMLYMSLPAGESPVVLLVVESVLVLIAVMAVAHFTIGFSGPTAQQPPAEDGRDRSGLFGMPGLAGIGASFAAMLLLTFILVQTSLRGQAVVGTAVAAIGASAVGILATRQLGGNSSILGPLLGIAAFGLVAPVVSVVMAGDLAQAARDGSLLPFAYIQPLDWAAAMLLGTPIGVAWAASSIEPQPADDKRSGTTERGRAIRARAST